MYKLYFSNVSDIETTAENLFSNFPASVKEKIAAKNNEKSRILSICGYSAALRGLAEFGVSNIIFSKTGKPETDKEGIYISISHSGSLAVCAISDKPIGVDTERIKNVDMRLFTRRFSPFEIEWIGNEPVRFFSDWTAREAYGKLLGKGVSAALTVPVVINDGCVSIDGYALNFSTYGENIICVCQEK